MNANSDILCSEISYVLQKEEERIVTSFPLERRVGLIELARACDGLFMHTETSEGDENDMNKVLHDLYRYGWNKSLSLFLDASSQNGGFPMMKSTEDSLQWAHSIIQHCGRIAQVQQFIDLWKTGMLDLSRGDAGEYCFSIIGNYIGLEALEQQHFVWLRDQIARSQRPLGEILNLSYRNIREQLVDNVAPCPIHGIKYSATSDLDDYYEQAGILRARLMLGQDSFPGDAPFGGHDFNLYRAVTALLVGWTLKHVAFCNTLASIYPNTDMSQVLTIHCRIDDLSRQIADALEITDRESEQSLNVLVLNTHNKHIHCSRTAGPPPPFIEVGQGHLLWSVRGCLDAPFEFMLRELKHQYPRDWDRNLNLREAYFKHELYQFFPQQRYIKATRPMILKAGKQTLTDVDAAIYDCHANVLALFQLKWQELFGSDMIERASRKSNFTREANHWVNTVVQWLKDASTEEITQKLNWPRASLTNLQSIRLYVIGRNSAFFSGSLPDERAAWGIWPQLVRLFHNEYNGMLCDDADPLTWLFEALKKDAPSVKPSQTVGRHEIVLGGIKVVGMATYGDADTAPA